MAEIVLYDLASTQNVCFSPIVWRIRLILNYKQIPYRTVFLELPDIEPTLKALGIVAEGPQSKYTVPAIHHIPSNKHIMESSSIAEFLESTYPNPPVPLTSALGQEVLTKSRSAIGPVFHVSILPREIHILPPRSQEYFRRTREASLGHTLEEQLKKEEDGEMWKAVDDSLPALGELIRTHKAEGPFVLGSRPSYVDFTIAGSLQSARVVDERVFHRIGGVDGFRDVYEACLPFMERDN